jgi:hypothetical protein
MTNRAVALAATPENPVSLTVNDMFSLMPYENSLVVMEMNGPQLKAVLERGYRNFYYYEYVSGYGGYSYYTTCMLDIDAGGQIVYNDLPELPYNPAYNYVQSLTLPDGRVVDFSDASTYYRVSTVNYLAAGACNFSEGGQTLWPLSQIVDDTQYYVRDAVIEYIQAQVGPINPQIEGRLVFAADTAGPVITVVSPLATSYDQSELLVLDFYAQDLGIGLDAIWADLDGVTVVSGQVIPLYTLLPGDHTLTVYASDFAGNQSSITVTFSVNATVDSTMAALNYFYSLGDIKDGIYNGLLAKLEAAQAALARGQYGAAANNLNAFINQILAQKGKGITEDAADLLMADAQWVISTLRGHRP